MSWKKLLFRARTLCALMQLGLAFACSGKYAHEVASDPGPTAREPQQHRPSGSACPTMRGANATGPTTCELGPVVDCLVDSDCGTGTNPRCSYVPTFACVTSCTSDSCFADADCPSNEPCVCRAGDSDPDANYCDTNSGCRVDADCGPGGYCSPSLLGLWCVCMSPAFCDPPCANGCSCGDSCGHGYFCHTPRDGCLDDSDCKTSEYCSFDKVERRFSCQSCSAIP